MRSRKIPAPSAVRRKSVPFLLVYPDKKSSMAMEQKWFEMRDAHNASSDLDEAYLARIDIESCPSSCKEETC
jgi:hypothetical protein